MPSTAVTGVARIAGLSAASSRIDEHHLMVGCVRANALPASLLPRVLECWETPARPELLGGRTASLLFNAFTEVMKTRSPRQQMKDSLRLTRMFRHALTLDNV